MLTYAQPQCSFPSRLFILGQEPSIPGHRAGVTSRLPQLTFPRFPWVITNRPPQREDEQRGEVGADCPGSAEL